MEKCIKFVKNGLTSNKFDKSDLVCVLLIGGTSKVTLVENRLTEFMGPEVEISSPRDPELLVVKGAAILARYIDEVPDKKMKVLDRTANIIGVEVDYGYIDVLIEKNTAIPTSKCRNYTSIADNRTEILIVIHESEEMRASVSTRIASFELSGINESAAYSEVIKVE